MISRTSDFNDVVSPSAAGHAGLQTGGWPGHSLQSSAPERISENFDAEVFKFTYIGMCVQAEGKRNIL